MKLTIDLNLNDDLSQAIRLLTELQDARQAKARDRELTPMQDALATLRVRPETPEETQAREAYERAQLEAEREIERNRLRQSGFWTEEQIEQFMTPKENAK